jgi:hypothetical protein
VLPGIGSNTTHATDSDGGGRLLTESVFVAQLLNKIVAAKQIGRSSVGFRVQGMSSGLQVGLALRLFCGAASTAVRQPRLDQRTNKDTDDLQDGLH